MFRCSREEGGIYYLLATLAWTNKARSKFGLKLSRRWGTIPARGTAASQLWMVHLQVTIATLTCSVCKPIRTVAWYTENWLGFKSRDKFYARSELKAAKTHPLASPRVRRHVTTREPLVGQRTVALKFVDTFQFWLKSVNNENFHEETRISARTSDWMENTEPAAEPRGVIFSNDIITKPPDTAPTQ
jgi:hypothetical protein